MLYSFILYLVRRVLLVAIFVVRQRVFGWAWGFEESFKNIIFSGWMMRVCVTAYFLYQTSWGGAVVTHLTCNEKIPGPIPGFTYCGDQRWSIGFIVLIRIIKVAYFDSPNKYSKPHVPYKSWSRGLTLASSHHKWDVLSLSHPILLLHSKYAFT